MPSTRPALRLLAALLLAALLSAAAFTAWVWHQSEAHLTSFPPPPAFTTPIPVDAATIAHGAHLALTRGCIGCHGATLQGEVFTDNPVQGRAVAANLTRLVHDNPPAIFERAVRHGIGHNGRALYHMPSFSFTRLSDADIAALYAYVRSLPVAKTTLPSPSLAFPLRFDLAAGKDAAIPAFTAMVPALSHQSDPNPAVRRGEYLAMTSCTECHGFDLRGEKLWAPPGQGPPDLAIAASYDPAAFAHLMKTGKPPGNRDLGLMTRVAQGRFTHWTAQEVTDLHAFLTVLAKSP